VQDVEKAVETLDHLLSHMMVLASPEVLIVDI
jgi:hypothetical protein